MYSKSLTQGDCSRMSAGSGNRTSAPVQALDHKSNSLPLRHCALLWKIQFCKAIFSFNTDIFKNITIKSSIYCYKKVVRRSGLGVVSWTCDPVLTLGQRQWQIISITRGQRPNESKKAVIIDMMWNSLQDIIYEQFFGFLPILVKVFLHSFWKIWPWPLTLTKVTVIGT